MIEDSSNNHSRPVPLPVQLLSWNQLHKVGNLFRNHLARVFYHPLVQSIELCEVKPECLNDKVTLNVSLLLQLLPGLLDVGEVGQGDPVLAAQLLKHFVQLLQQLSLLSYKR